MFVKMIPVILGILIIIGGVWTIHAGHQYFKYLKTKGSNNLFSPYTVFYSYFIGFIFIMGGLSLCFGVV